MLEKNILKLNLDNITSQKNTNNPRNPKKDPSFSLEEAYVESEPTYVAHKRKQQKNKKNPNNPSASGSEIGSDVMSILSSRKNKSMMAMKNNFFQDTQNSQEFDQN